jgi:hypothetical protein
MSDLILDVPQDSTNAVRTEPALFMTVRREIAEPCRESGARSLEALRRTRAVR